MKSAHMIQQDSCMNNLDAIQIVRASHRNAKDASPPQTRIPKKSQRSKRPVTSRAHNCAYVKKKRPTPCHLAVSLSDAVLEVAPVSVTAEEVALPAARMDESAVVTVGSWGNIALYGAVVHVT